MADDRHPVRLGVDVGGTFTDVALVVGDDLTTAKVPTTTPQHAGVLDGVREACDAAGVAPADVDSFAHATTVSVNALLERDGARTALVTTAGFRDVLEIGRQTRPALYDLDAEKPAPLVPADRRFEVRERATPDGVETPADEAAVREAADVFAEADGWDEAVVERAAEYARTDAEEGVASSPFITLLFDFVREPANREIVFQRLSEHVQRRRARVEDVDGLFE